MLLLHLNEAIDHGKQCVLVWTCVDVDMCWCGHMLAWAYVGVDMCRCGHVLVWRCVGEDMC